MAGILPKVFVSFLDSLSFDAEEGGSELVELWPEMKGITPDADFVTRRPEYVEILGIEKASVTVGSNFVNKRPERLYQHGATEVSLAGFRKKLLEILRRANHVATDAVADAILGCVVGAASAGTTRAAFLEDALTRFRTAEVSHFFVLPKCTTAKPVCFDGYSFGEINFPVLASRCQRATSEYTELYAKDLRGRLALQSPDFKHVVIDFLKLGYGWRRLREKPRAYQLLLNYFSRISRLHFESMWMHLNRTQVLGDPFNASLLDVQALKSVPSVQRVTIYLDFSKTGEGCVIPEADSGIVLDEAGPDSEPFKRFLQHRNTFHLSHVGNSELGRILFACGGFCQRAIRFIEAEHSDDAALYATICLEYLFSEKRSTAEAVCSRAAALTHLRLSGSYSEAERELRNLYDARSAFVHSGKPVTATQAERLIAYARETLRSLLMLHLKPENRSQGFVERWVKELDVIVAGYKAGLSFEASFLAENGIFRL